MKILNLYVENIKKIKVAEIKPDGTLVIITGKNGQGKSSLLDSIILAFEYAKSKVLNPLRKGEDKGRIKIKMDNGMVLERKITPTGSKLVVTMDGEVQSSPQTILDKMKTEFTFDPLHLLSLKPKEQVQWLLKFIGKEKDLLEIDQKIKTIYDQRSEVNKDVKRVQVFFDEIKLPAEAYHLPDQELSIKDLNERKNQIIDKINQRNEIEKKGTELSTFIASTEKTIKSWNEMVENAEERIKELKEEIKSFQTSIITAAKSIMEAKAGKETLQNEWKSIKVEDPKAIDLEIEQVQEKNKLIQRKSLKWKTENELGDLKVRSEELTLDIENLQQEKRDILMEAKIPVEGLAFNEDGLTLNEIPFQDLSTSEQLKISMMLGMAANPDLKIMMTKHGSELDHESLALMQQVAQSGDYQLWIERVEEGELPAVHIVDGLIQKEVKDAPLAETD